MKAPLTWFCVWQTAEVRPVAAQEVAQLLQLLACCPGLAQGHVLLPTMAHDPYYPSPAGSPSLVVQLEFGDVQALEDALAADGPLAALLDERLLPGLAGVRPTQQAMLTRRYAVPDPRPRSAELLSYFVEYEGPAADTNAWHLHYNAHHPPLLAQFSGIRAIEIYTPAVATCGLGLAERPCLQRNKTVFDDAAAMNAAMRSPVREALRQDFHSLPAFQGPAHHFPFLTRSCHPGAAQ